MKFSKVMEVPQSSDPWVFAYLQEGGLNIRTKRDHSIVILGRMGRRDCMHRCPRYILEAFTVLIASWPGLMCERLILIGVSCQLLHLMCIRSCSGHSQPPLRSHNPEFFGRVVNAYDCGRINLKIVSNCDWQLHSSLLSPVNMVLSGAPFHSAHYPPSSIHEVLTLPNSAALPPFDFFIL